MQLVLSELAPVLIIILLGYGLRRSSMMSDAGWAGMEKLAYFVLFPALLVNTLSRQPPTDVPGLRILGVVLVTSIIAAGTLVAWYRFRGSVSGETFTSIFQGGVRFNSYIALGISQALFGDAGLLAGAVTIAFLIVTVNLLSVSAFSIWGRDGARGFRPFVRNLLLNPLVLSCLVGWFLSITGTGLPGIAGDVFGLVGRATLPVGLLAVGAALRLDAVRGHAGAIATASSVQFVLKPLIASLLIWVFSLGGVTAGVLYLTFVTPVAPSSYILARQLGGDTAVMASIITAQTLIAMGVMPVVALIARVPVQPS